VGHVLNHQKFQPIVCVVIKLDFLSTKFWFCFVCVMHMIWLVASVELFHFVYVVTSWFYKVSG
jgi:hypothetical protein